MLKSMRCIVLIVLAVSLFYSLSCQLVYAGDNESVKALVDRYRQAGDDNTRKDALKKLSQTSPMTLDEVNQFRAIFAKKEWDENLFLGAFEAIKKIKDPSLDNGLVDILKDEKHFIEKASRKEHEGKNEKEVILRLRNVEMIIYKLGELKSKNAVPLLKEYIGIQGVAYWASQALAMIGDTSASEKIRDKAYKGDEINYGGQGSEEALTVVRDLEDRNKKDQWPKIAKQIIHIHDPKAKPYLKRLLNHEQSYVRWEAADKFRALVDEKDIPTIIEMTKNKDKIIRAEAINAMQNLKNIEFEDELIALLNDPAYNVRRHAAKALGYKKISRAVPYLEKAIKDSELRDDNPLLGNNDKSNELGVREEAYIALYILTGKNYDFKGKRAGIEREAERQKDHPTFY